MVIQIDELNYATCISIQQVKQFIKQLDEIGYDTGGIPYNVCTEYNAYQGLTYFHIIILPVSSLYNKNSDVYKNYTNGNLIYRSDNKSI